jgi:hypothetical protein
VFAGLQDPFFLHVLGNGLYAAEHLNWAAGTFGTNAKSPESES